MERPRPTGDRLSAAAAIRVRPCRRLRRPPPDRGGLLATDDATLRGVGLSRAKAIYLHDLAERLVDGRLDLDRLCALEDDAAPADGVLLLALRRKDVWPTGDLALRRASGNSTARHRSPMSMPSATASARGAPSSPSTS
jgi:DNA-3-methyladenine glycosylase II